VSAAPAKKHVPTWVSVLVVVVALGAVAAVYYYGTNVPTVPAKPKKVMDMDKLAGEQILGPKTAALQVEAFFLPLAGEAAMKALRELQAKYPKEVSLYLGSPNMARGKKRGAQDGDIFLNRKRVATKGDVETARRLIEEKVKTSPAPAPAPK
jgi:hypothetical protein